METKKVNATIDEVAKRAGVSKTTISRYINGRYEYMSEDTRKSIQSIIEELDYRPNNIARSLKSNKSGLIGAIIADITNPYSSIIIKGIGDICKEKGYQVIIANTDNDPIKEKEYLQSLVDSRVEGVIVHATGKNNDFLVELGKQGIPIVLADRQMEDLKFDTVISNNYEITFNTIKYLIGQGYKKIGFITEEIGTITSRNIRRQAFLDANKEFLNIDASDLIYIVKPSEEKQMINSLKDFHENHKGEPRVVFAVNGVTLLSVLQGISKLEYKIPEDLGVCGFDDWGWAALIPPGITVISQPSYEVGVESANRLIARINSKKKAKPKLIELPAELVIRGSTLLKK